MSLPVLNIFRGSSEPGNAGARETSGGPMPLPHLFRVLRRQYRRIAVVTVLFVAAALAYSLFAPKIFRASASLLIDVRQDDPLRKEQRAADSQVETAFIESQVKLMSSDAVARQVVRSLKLTEDPEFVGDDRWLPMRLLGALTALLSPSDSGTEPDIEKIATERLVNAIKPSRVGRTYLVDVDVLSRDPVKAAAIANAIAKAYTDDQLNARIAAAEKSAEWLKDRAAELRQQSLEADRAVQTFSARADRERVELKSLETTAQTYRALFENYLKQYTTAVQQQSFPISFARVVTPATPPKRKSYPRTTLLLLGALVGGAGIGWLLGFARETFRRTVETEADIRDETGLVPIGTLPEITNGRRPLFGTMRSGKLLEHFRAPASGTRGPVFVGRSNALMQIARLYPHSRFAETIKNIKATVALEGGTKIRTIGIISTQPGEGKTVVAANLAQLLASAGARTILVDCNFRNPTLTEATPPGVPDGPNKPDQGIFIDAASGLAFRPVSAEQRGGSLADILTDPTFRSGMAKLSDRYDYVIVDLPCLESNIEARAVASIVDGSVVVCAAEELLVDRLTASSDRWARAGLSPLLGFVLNKARSRREIDPPRLPPAPVPKPGIVDLNKAA